MNDLRNLAFFITDKLIAQGYTTYLAGGCVRDSLLGQVCKDVDIVTSATPEQIRLLFPQSNAVGAHFGVMIVKSGGVWFDVATFRRDGEYEDGRHPNRVVYSDPQDDAARRDFTINGLFEEPRTGRIIDYVGGLGDIKSRVIRCIGCPRERFQEDGLRLLRAVRFAVRTGFEIESSTYQALCDHSSLLEKISVERIFKEFCLIMSDPRRALGVKLLMETGLMRYIIPEVYDLVGCDQPPQWHPEGDVYVHTMLMLEMLRPDASLALSLSTLLHDIGKPPVRHIDETGRIRFNTHDTEGAELTRRILRRLKASNTLIDDVEFMVARHMKFMHVQSMRLSKLRIFMGSPLFSDEMELHRVDCMSSNRFMDNYEFLQRKMEEWAHEPVLPEPLISGADLKELGLTPSPQFREILNHVREEQLEGRLNTSEEALSYVKKLI